MNIISSFKFCLLILLGLLLSSCLKKQKFQEPKKESNIPTVTLQKPYNIFIADIECDLCAQSAVDALSLIPGVTSVSYELTDATYENGHIKLWISHNAHLNEDLIRQQLKPLDFELKAIIQS